MRARAFLLACLAGALPGCGMVKDDPTSSHEIDQNVNEVEFQAKESRTRSALAKIEASLRAYVDEEKKIPEKLEDLVPKYLAEIPNVELGITGYHDTNQVKIYPRTILRDGIIDGAKLRDSGRWGYVHNDERVVIFIDCTRKSSQGIPWFQERGVY